jgi:DNA-binding SARP family transcriptional activator/tetratricopeptide (TPR) repeat protein
MRFRMLGPLEIWSGSGWTGISAGKQRALLACMLLKSPQIVPIETLIFELWRDAPPPTANNLVSMYVTQLRRAIGDPHGRVLIRREPGYQLKSHPEDTDLRQFEQLVARGRKALAGGDAETAASLLTAAEALWRGGFLADVAPSAFVSGESERSVELRMSAAELRIAADLGCGRCTEVIPELRSLVGEHPLRERLWLLLMRALDDAGRHAESLSVYGQARSVISEELGVDPGPELQKLYAELLAPEAPSLRERPIRHAALADFASVPAGEAPLTPYPTEPAATRPAQLPADIADFTGRATQVSLLCEALTRPDGTSGPGTVRIAVVAGAAGIGKTILAVHAGHQVRELFPDGQLYADLRGASTDPTPPGEALARFLRDLGLDGDKIPADDEERAALYRTRLTGRRMLILLDNAKDAAQVRPLLPGTASCAVLVTTRNRTPYLVSTRFVDLNTLREPEALELFSRIAGHDRAGAEPDGTAEVLLACAGLPLAIRICGTRLATRGQWRIATMADRLRDERHRLDEFKVGDLEVRASFRVSYDSLDAGGCRTDPARAFRLLGLWQGQEISLSAAASLIGEREENVAAALETLVDANLLESPEPNWYQLHDLLRLFATERVQAEETEEARAGAMARLVQDYQAAATVAADMLSPYRYRIAGEDPRSGPPPGSAQRALDWYDREHDNLTAAIWQAAAAGLHDAAWRLPTALFPFFTRSNNWADCVASHRIAVGSARLSGSLPGEAWALHHLGYGLARLGDAEAFSCLQEAFTLRQEMGDTGGEARTAIALTEAHYRIHGIQAGYDYSLQCLELLRNAGDPALLGIGLNNHGEFCLFLGKTAEAAESLQEALGICTEIWGRNGRGHVLENLGRIDLESGRLPEAITTLSEAHRIHVAQGHLMGQAMVLKYLAKAQRGVGQEDQARTSLRTALTLFENLGADEEAETINFMLAARDNPRKP